MTTSTYVVSLDEAGGRTIKAIEGALRLMEEGLDVTTLVIRIPNTTCVNLMNHKESARVLKINSQSCDEIMRYVANRRPGLWGRLQSLTLISSTRPEALLKVVITFK